MVRKVAVLPQGECRGRLCSTGSLCKQGLELSKLSALPPQIVAQAFRLCEEQKLAAPAAQPSPHDTSLVRLGIVLVQLARNALLDERSLRGYLQALAAKYRGEQ